MLRAAVVLAALARSPRLPRCQGWPKRESRESRSRDWKSLGQREAEDRAKRSKEWQSLGQEERQRREERDREEQAALDKLRRLHRYGAR